MTFDPNKPHKNVDGTNINLTDAEIAEIAAAEASYAPPSPPPPDLATQLAALLISKGAIDIEELAPETAEAISAKMEVSSQKSIK